MPSGKWQGIFSTEAWFWCGVQVPLNVWLPWLPQLQTSLQRPEAALVKDLLAQLATTYPQAVYYGLRTILLSLREVHHQPCSHI